ncbi:ribosome maturation factor RimM [Antarcticimicrobium sediminis]|uniref:Ribosome maturation factor RimM n=1 Tax=Antarcticimicrobium sediminis TaxID=2546227 RepID=A0A4R5ERJ7_9RHOB|nr:ribosome maturation factor RimM [Antarcticimicrobium sediminis]TDE37429.1 16S rRNA processing protein RimM [Antarcticimicrobium sediminis]
MTNSPVDTLVCVGAIGGAFGVRGELRLKSFCAVPEDIEGYAPLSTEDGTRSFTVRLTGRTTNGLTARLGGVDSKEAADALRGMRLFAPRERLPALPDDEYYHADLIGVEVLDTGGTVLGHVKSVQNHGASDLLEIAAPGTNSTVLLPFTREAVPTVDLEAGRIIADPPDGLF